MNYKTELPEEPTPAMLDVADYVVSIRKNLLFEKEGTYFYSWSYMNQQEVEYYSYTEEALKDFYIDFFRTDTDTGDVLDLWEVAEDKLFQKVEQPMDYSLPLIQIQEDNILHIETDEAEREYDLTELLSNYDMQANDDISVNVAAVTEDSFQIDINNNSKDYMEVGLFFKQDLSDVVVSKPFGSELEKSLQEGKFADFEDLFVELGSNGHLFKTALGHEIWNKEKKELIRIDEDDYLSEDGQFVYLDGRDRGRQDGNNHYIQRVEDYLEGNDEYYSVFKLYYEEMGEEVEIDSVGAGIVDLKYFNEQYAVFFVNFNGAFVGTTGSINVIVDYINDTAYIVDWEYN